MSSALKTIGKVACVVPQRTTVGRAERVRLTSRASAKHASVKPLNLGQGLAGSRLGAVKHYVSPSFGSRNSRPGVATRASPSDTSEQEEPGAKQDPATVREITKVVGEASALSPEAKESKDDVFLAMGVSAFVAILLAAFNRDFVASHESVCMVGVFLAGYAGIIFEEDVALNKSGIGMLMAVALWTVHAIASPDTAVVKSELNEHLADVSEIVFFLMGAMTIVETVDSHRGFKIVTDAIKSRNSTTLLWLVSVITFFMSAILDNLTTTIVMVSLLRKLIPNDPKRRMFFGGAVVIAANAGGAWTPIGDVTTTMLWINGQITALNTMSGLLFPSIISVIVSVAAMTLFSEEASGDTGGQDEDASIDFAPGGKLVFGAGVGSLLFVPVFKAITDLPPYLGMLWGLGFMWVLTDALHHGKPEREELSVSHNLTKIDTTGVLFFLGILLSIGSLESVGVLTDVAVWLGDHVPSTELVAGSIGLASAVIDNVPLVAATMGMYSLNEWPVDSELWQLIAYCAGTGGSILIIGSAAGVAFMGMERAEFGWYVKKISPWALIGYMAGIGTYVGQDYVLGNFLAPAVAEVGTIMPHLPFN